MGASTEPLGRRFRGFRKPWGRPGTGLGGSLTAPTCLCAHQLGQTVLCEGVCWATAWSQGRVDRGALTGPAAGVWGHRAGAPLSCPLATSVPWHLTHPIGLELPWAPLTPPERPSPNGGPPQPRAAPSEPECERAWGSGVGGTSEGGERDWGTQKGQSLRNLHRFPPL